MYIDYMAIIQYRITNSCRLKLFSVIYSHEWILYFQISTNNLYIYTLIMCQSSKGVIALTHIINIRKHCSILCIHYEKSPLLKPHYPTIKTKKKNCIQLLCNYPLGITSIV
jgi:hypothetical protein